MPPRLPKPVPWNSPSEFRQIYEWFFPPRLEDGSPDIRAQECAMRRVKAWEARGKLPHAIDSTMAFVQVMLRDWSGICSDQDLRVMYSMVIIRFVNGYVDGFQTSKAARSIAYLAQEKVGMPLWFVELRHTATHDYLPSLTILRRAADEALAWMDVNYWIPQLNAIMVDEEPNEEMTSAMVNDVRLMIQSYRDQKEQQISEMSLLPPKQETIAMNRLMKELLRRCETGDHLLDALLTILVEPGMLVPKSKKKRASTQDLTLAPLGEMVHACWMPLMTRLHSELKEISSIKTGDVLLFWDEMMDVLLDELRSSGSSNSATGAQVSSMGMDVDGSSTGASGSSISAQGEKGSRPTSYLLTVTAWIKHLITQHYQRVAASKRHATTISATSATTSSSLSSPSSSPCMSNLSVSATMTSTAATTPNRPSFASMAAKLVSSSSVGQSTANGPEIDAVYIAQTCLENANPFTRSVLNTIMQHDQEIKSRIEHLVKRIDQQLQGGGPVSSTMAAESSLPAANAAAPPPTASVDHDMASPPSSATPLPSPSPPAPPPTSATIPSNNSNSSSSKESPDTPSGSNAPTVWTMVDDSVWRPTPMGCLPGGLLPDLSLPWELDSQPIARVPLS